MKTMEVLLRENMLPLGKCGDIVKVKAGYARNYLLPKKLAIEANEDNKKAMERRRLRLDAEEAEQAAEIETRILVLQSVKLHTKVKADDTGRLYGSVNAGTIAELLAAQGKQVEEKDVRLETTIKKVGTHPVRIHVHGERFAEIEIEVTTDNPAVLAAQAAKAAEAAAKEAAAEAGDEPAAEGASEGASGDAAAPEGTEATATE